MGFRTVAIGRGPEKEKLAKDLGAHIYIDTSAEDAAAVLQRKRGGAAWFHKREQGTSSFPEFFGLVGKELRSAPAALLRNLL